MKVNKSKNSNSAETDQTVSDLPQIAKLGHGLTMDGDISQYYARKNVNPLSQMNLKKH